MPRIKIDRELCKGCGICLQVCPKGVLQLSEVPNSRGFRVVEPGPNKEVECVACGQCFTVCPDHAIEIEDDRKP